MKKYITDADKREANIGLVGVPLAIGSGIAINPVTGLTVSGLTKHAQLLSRLKKDRDHPLDPNKLSTKLTAVVSPLVTTRTLFPLTGGAIIGDVVGRLNNMNSEHLNKLQLGGAVLGATLGAGYQAHNMIKKYKNNKEYFAKKRK